MESHKMYSFISHVMCGKFIPVSVSSKAILSHRGKIDHYMTIRHFINSTVDGHWECFQFLNGMSMLACLLVHVCMHF